MTAARFYSSTSGVMELQADISAASSTMQVDSVTGLPGTTPFSLVLEPGVVASEEIVTVTNVGGTTLTITRGVDGSSATAHSAGAEIRHMATARDFREPQEHIGASTAVHGLESGSAVVGTTDTQTLNDKTLQASALGAIGAVVKGAVGQTASYLEVQKSDGTATLKVKPGDGTVVVTGTTEINDSDSANLFNYVARFTSGGVAAVVGIFKRKVGQTADILQIQNESGTALAKFDKDGKLTTPQVTSTGDVSGTTGTFSGAITSPTITTLTAADTALDGRLDTLEAEENHGRTTVTTDASGNALVAHGLGVTPAVVVGTGEITGTTPMIVDIYRPGTGSTNINFVCFKDDGTRWASASVTINWIAYR